MSIKVNVIGRGNIREAFPATILTVSAGRSGNFFLSDGLLKGNRQQGRHRLGDLNTEKTRSPEGDGASTRWSALGNEQATNFGFDQKFLRLSVACSLFPPPKVGDGKTPAYADFPNVPTGVRVGEEV
ncbi:hypothetical protein V0288_20100 [Pannus brasiliensis CCIBt3594]|uniref:Ribosomal protein L2 n=1 Tax=Pannus brasiliensis CCIBt3594 TaxID=1427578 RepID=A0AAW9QNS5_9CHRO